MEIYKVEFYKQHFIHVDSKPHGPYDYDFKAESFEEAKNQAALELVKMGWRSGSSDIVAARIRSEPDGEWHKVLDHLPLEARV